MDKSFRRSYILRWLYLVKYYEWWKIYINDTLWALILCWWQNTSHQTNPLQLMDGIGRHRRFLWRSSANIDVFHGSYNGIIFREWSFKKYYLCLISYLNLKAPPKYACKINFIVVIITASAEQWQLEIGRICKRSSKDWPQSLVKMLLLFLL